MENPLLGQVPLQPIVSIDGDQGRPVVLDNAALAGAELKQVAEKIRQSLADAPAEMPLEIASGRITV